MKAILIGVTVLLTVSGVVAGPASATTLQTGSQVSPNSSGQLIATPSTLVLSTTTGNTTTVQTGASFSDPSGWDPWGDDIAYDDTNSQWLSVGGCCGGTSTAVFNATSTALQLNTFSLLWGSPNSDNTVTLYSGLNGLGTQVGQVQFIDGSGYLVDGVLSSQPYGPNTMDPGYIETITTSQLFESAVLSNGTGGFEIADVSAGFLQLQNDLTPTPLPSAWTTLLGGLVGVGFLALVRTKKRSATILAA